MLKFQNGKLHVREFINKIEYMARGIYEYHYKVSEKFEILETLEFTASGTRAYGLKPFSSL